MSGIKALAPGLCKRQRHQRPEEVIAIVLNKPTREIEAGDQPTELVRDPSQDDFTAGKRSFGFDAYFDMDGDGTVADAERYTSG